MIVAVLSTLNIFFIEIILKLNEHKIKLLEL